MEVEDIVADRLDQEGDAVQHYLESLLKPRVRITELRVGNGVVAKKGLEHEIKAPQPDMASGDQDEAPLEYKSDERAGPVPEGAAMRQCGDETKAVSQTPQPEAQQPASADAASPEVPVAEPVGQAQASQAVPEGGDETRLDPAGHDDLAVAETAPAEAQQPASVDAASPEVPDAEPVGQAQASQAVPEGGDETRLDPAGHGGDRAAAEASVPEEQPFASQDALSSAEPARQEPEGPAPVSETSASSAQHAHWQAAVATLRMQVFVVAGIRLAVPVSEVLAENARAGALMPAAEGPEWLFTGMRGDQPSWLVDMHRLIVPAGRRQRLSAPPLVERAVLWLRPGGVGLLCDRILGESCFDESGVVWSTERRKRAWLAGTATDQRCAVIDVAGLLRLLPA